MEKSKKYQLSMYDVKSGIIYCLLVILPVIMTNIGEIQNLLLSKNLDPTIVNIIITSIGIFVKKFLTNYQK